MDEAVRQVEHKADELYNCTLEAMKGYKDFVWALKDVLLERYVLSKDEVFSLLDDLMDVQQRKAA